MEEGEAKAGVPRQQGDSHSTFAAYKNERSQPSFTTLHHNAQAPELHRRFASSVSIHPPPSSSAMEHKDGHYEREQLKANLAAKDVKIQELHAALSRVALRLESGTAELRGVLEMERIRCREAE